MLSLFTSLLLLGPRAAFAVWWLINPMRWSLAIESFLIQIPGFIFLPWTTSMYVIIWNPMRAFYNFDWVWLGSAFLSDIGTHAGGAWGNKDKIPGVGGPKTTENTLAPPDDVTPQA